MPLPAKFIGYQDSRLYYSRVGTGPDALLLFHGFGQDNQVFAEWEAPLGSRYTLYSFDLYFHGQSTWPSRDPLLKTDWKQIIRQFMETEKITSFEVAGFSLGGKFALATLEAFPEKVKRIILLAPDGVKPSTWYTLATYPLIVRSLFKSMVLYPGRFYSLAKFLRQLGLVNKGILRFAELQMDTGDKRKRVYLTWVYFRRLKFNLTHIAHLLNAHGVPLLIVAGKYDQVIPPGKMERLLRRVDQSKLEVIDSGHNDLIRKSPVQVAG